MLDLSFQYPAWFLIFCVLLGLGYALLLYYRDNTFRDQAPNLNRWLGLMRWITVTLLSALLLSPLLKSFFTETKKPIVSTAHCLHDVKRDLHALDVMSCEMDLQDLGDPVEMLLEPHLNPFASSKRTWDTKEHIDAQVVTTNEYLFAFQAYFLHQ